MISPDEDMPVVVSTRCPGRVWISAIGQRHIKCRKLLSVFEPLLMKMIEHLKYLLEKTPPELSRDLLETGLVITGGGALMRGIDVFFKEHTRLPVRIASDPLTCVALGTGILIQQKSYWK